MPIYRRATKTRLEAYGVSEGHNQALEEYMGTPFIPMSQMETTDEDIIIAVRWEHCAELEQYRGRKFQFVQGRDLDANCGDDWKAQLRNWRNNPNWKLIGVSEFCLRDWCRGTVIPNGIDARFFKDHQVYRDYDILIEGNAEPNKGIEHALALAKSIPNAKIAWMGRETYPVDGVETITNPAQWMIPIVYQKSKVMIKLSKSEGFSLPILEAFASGCAIITHDMGGNDFCEYGKNCDTPNNLKKVLEDEWHRHKLTGHGYATAKKFTIEKSVDKLLHIL